MSRHATPPGTPRWPALAGLALVVAGVHLWLLGVPWPPGADDAALRPVALAPDAPATPAPTGQAATPAGPATPPAARAVTVSTVRWVVAPPAPQSPAERPTPRQRPAEAAPRPAAPAAAPRLPEVAAAPPGEAASEPPAATAPPAVADGDTLTALASPAQAVAPAAPANPAAALPPASPPGSAALVYEVSGTVKGLAYQAQATLDWTREADRYEARLAVRLPLLGSRVQTSAGRVDATGLVPERFGDKARSEKAAHFDHAQQRIRFSANTPDAELQPGAQDRLSLFLQLAARLNAAPQPVQAGQLIELQVAGTSDAQPWRFRVGDEETLTLPAGDLRVRQLVREPREPRDSRVELWLAPELAHLPVRIRIEQHTGDQIDQRLSRLP
jgi:hypothetical protein